MLKDYDNDDYSNDYKINKWSGGGGPRNPVTDI
jgi:hypothetical protein